MNSANLTRAVDALKLNPKGLAEIATEGLYHSVNRKLPGNLEVDQALRPILLEELEAGITRALERWEETHGKQATPTTAGRRGKGGS